MLTNLYKAWGSKQRHEQGWWKPRLAIATMMRINIRVFRACTEMDISDNQYRRHIHRWDRVAMLLNPMGTSVNYYYYRYTNMEAQRYNSQEVTVLLLQGFYYQVWATIKSGLLSSLVYHQVWATIKSGLLSSLGYYQVLVPDQPGLH